MYGVCSETANSPQPIVIAYVSPFCSENIPKTKVHIYPLQQRILINAAGLCEDLEIQPADARKGNQVPRKKKVPTPRHPADAMARFDRLLSAMAPRVPVPENAAPKPLQPRGRRRRKAGPPLP
jgi:hypothetical protein